MYTTEILWLLSWPALIYISYLAVRWAVKKFESKLEKE
jgi:hypothetical protein